ncbi:3-hydroxyacyl-CoA dehydrogenase family protein [Caproiciproducens sp.]
MAVKKVGVLGAGRMGLGIVQVFAEAGLHVVVVDTFPAAVENALKRLASVWSRAVEKGKITEQEKNASLDRVVASGDMKALAECDLVIEAVPEQMDLKKEMFVKLDDICKAETILATNTSALSITEIAAVTKRPKLVLGTHFFNPVPAMKLVEIVPTKETDDVVVDTVMELFSSIGKEPIRVKESPGFLVNRILTPYMTEAFFAYQEDLASAEDIDKAMKLGAGMPMGPLELADMVGLDVCLMVSEHMYHEFGDSKYRPAQCLRQLVRAGNLGMKTGKGFHKYPKK